VHLGAAKAREMAVVDVEVVPPLVDLATGVGPEVSLQVVHGRHASSPASATSRARPPRAGVSRITTS
jgi:hypothetical protein